MSRDELVDEIAANRDLGIDGRNYWPGYADRMDLGLALLDLPLGRSRSAAVLLTRAARTDPGLEGAPPPSHRQLTPAAVSVSAGGRPGDRDRVGEEPADRAGRLPRVAGRAPPADSR